MALNEQRAAAEAARTNGQKARIAKERFQSSWHRQDSPVQPNRRFAPRSSAMLRRLIEWSANNPFIILLGMVALIRRRLLGPAHQRRSVPGPCSGDHRGDSQVPRRTGGGGRERQVRSRSRWPWPACQASRQRAANRCSGCRICATSSNTAWITPGPAGGNQPPAICCRFTGRSGPGHFAA